MADVHKIFEEDDIRIKTPFRWFCFGPSGSGKTTFLKHLLANVDKILSSETRNIVYCYKIYQPLFDEIKAECSNVIFI